jgi:alcohol dehydrogenase class IV
MSGGHEFTRDDPDRIVFRRGAEADVAAELERLGARRVLLTCQPGHTQGAKRILASLGSRAVGLFDRAQPQVPRETADAAIEAAREAGADWVLAHGGGTAIGVAKAVALTLPVKVAAVPTSYAGSERTNIYGITEGGLKTTGRDDRVRPKLVVYDPDLSQSLPREFSLQSLVNALAHSLEALYADDADARAIEAATESLAPLVSALRGLSGDPDDRAARDDALLGAYLASEALAHASIALHHKLAHVFSGTLGTPHAATHTVLLPYTIAYNLPAAPRTAKALADALHTDDPAGGLWGLLHEVGLPTSLRALQVDPDRLGEVADLATQKPYPNPRPFDRASLLELLDDAWHDRRPSSTPRRDS